MSNMRMAKYETLIEDINSNIKKSRDFENSRKLMKV